MEENKMGLSSGERLQKIIWVLKIIAKMKFTCWEYKSLNEHISKLWPNFFGNNGNSGHWLFGSDSSAECLEEDSPLGISFLESKRKNLEQKTKKEFEDTKSWYNDFIANKSFLEGEDAQIWTLLSCIETYFYAANRYPGDEFSQKLKLVTDEICHIRGILQTILEEEKFSKAWMFKHILKWGFDYGHDVIEDIFEELYLHHYLKLDALSFEQIYKIFVKWQKRKPKTAKERLFILLSLLTNFEVDERQLATFLGHLVEWNEKNPKDEVNLNKVADFLAKSVKKEKQETRKYIRWCNFTKQEI
jgi:hypothetical protein